MENCEHYWTQSNEIYTTDFLDRNQINFYKYDKWPCFILEIQNNGSDLIYVRILDRQGEYIQEMKLIKIKNKYRIKDILYDI